MIEAGTHQARANSWALGKASTGTVQVAVEFGLSDGRSITWFGPLTEKALEHTVKGLRACGWEGADISELAVPTCGLDKNEVELVVEVEEYNGETRAKVRWVNAVGGGLRMAATLEGGELAAFAAKLKGRILGLDPSSAARRAAGPARPPEPPPPGDADVPF